jgi:arsenate reductase
MELFKKLENTIESAKHLPIPKERKEHLQELIDFIQKKKKEQKPILLNFICTHNSRRSQFSQIWAQTAADLEGIPVQIFSGGVEVTAFNEMAVDSIKRAGFHVTQRT